ncbi:MAG TPA: HAD family phosphatase [Solirubrobacteraceae bacterium]|nr:HAD family phosphatase [Solirubrobacteraceae bacterium]
MSDRGVRGGGPAAVVFDLDGVLLDSEEIWSGARRELALRCGGRWSDAAQTYMLGMSSSEWSRYMHDHLGVALAAREISDRVVELVAARYRARLPLIAGADEAVRALAACWPLGLASSANRQIIELVLDRAGWRALFAQTVSSEEVARGKPAPDVYLEAARRLGAAPDRCAAVEDSAAGIESAHAATLAVIAIPNRQFPPGDAALAQADLVLEQISQLHPAAVAGLTARGRSPARGARRGTRPRPS